MKRGIAVATLGATVLTAAGASAHEVGISRGDYAIEGTVVRADIVFARKELAGLVAGLDANHDGALTPAEIADARDAIEGALVGRVNVRGDGSACRGSLVAADLAEQDGVAVHAIYRCAAPPRSLAIELAFLDDLGFGHRHLARATAGALAIDRVLSQREPILSIDVPAGASPPRDADDAASPLRRGALRVIARPESPAFLLVMLASCASRRAAAIATAAFAAAIAFGFALGVHGLFAPSPRVIAAAIAISLVYAGLEAATSPPSATRWRIALPFGIVHGLGFAAAFGAVSMRSGEVAGFAAGVAIAIMLTAVAIFAITEWARGAPSLHARGALAVGVIVAAAGAIGLVLSGT